MVYLCERLYHSFLEVGGKLKSEVVFKTLD